MLLLRTVGAGGPHFDHRGAVNVDTRKIFFQISVFPHMKLNAIFQIKLSYKIPRKTILVPCLKSGHTSDKDATYLLSPLSNFYYCLSYIET